MDPEAAINRIRTNRQIHCTAEEYELIRPALQKYAADMIRIDHHATAVMAHSEIARLDAIHMPKLPEHQEGESLPPAFRR